MADEHKFPTEVIDLPSGGKLYPQDSPLRDGKLEIKYMTILRLIAYWGLMHI